MQLRNNIREVDGVYYHRSERKTVDCKGQKELYEEGRRANNYVARYLLQPALNFVHHVALLVSLGKTIFYSRLMYVALISIFALCPPLFRSPERHYHYFFQILKRLVIVCRDINPKTSTPL